MKTKLDGLGGSWLTIIKRENRVVFSLLVFLTNTRRCRPVRLMWCWYYVDTASKLSSCIQLTIIKQISWYPSHLCAVLGGCREGGTRSKWYLERWAGRETEGGHSREHTCLANSLIIRAPPSTTVAGQDAGLQQYHLSILNKLWRIKNFQDISVYLFSWRQAVIFRWVLYYS